MTRRLALLLPVLLAACSASSSAPDDVTDDSALSTGDSIASDADLARVRTAIDNVCGDTWCEGDYDWAFNRLTCSKASASCRFEIEAIARITVWASDDGTAPDLDVAKIRYPHTCVVKDIHKRSDVVSGKGSQMTYAEAFYDKVDECVGAHETEVAKLSWRDEVLRWAERCEPGAHASADLAERQTAWSATDAESRAKQTPDVFPGAADALAWTVGDKLTTTSSDPVCTRWSAQLTTGHNVVAVRGAASDGRAGEVVLLAQKPFAGPDAPPDQGPPLEVRLSLKRW